MIAGGGGSWRTQVDTIASIVYAAVDKDAQIIFGAGIDKEMGEDEIAVTVLATGFALSTDAITNPGALPGIVAPINNNGNRIKAAIAPPKKKKAGFLRRLFRRA